MEICIMTILDIVNVRTLRGRSKEQLDKRIINRVGTVSDYPRLAIHVWHLVAEALKAVKYDQRPPGKKEI